MRRRVRAKLVLGQHFCGRRAGKVQFRHGGQYPAHFHGRLQITPWSIPPSESKLGVNSWRLVLVIDVVEFVSNKAEFVFKSTSGLDDNLAGNGRFQAMFGRARAKLGRHRVTYGRTRATYRPILSQIWSFFSEMGPDLF